MLTVNDAGIEVSIRPTARRWLALQGRRAAGAIYSSKFYLAEESWTGRDAWWLNIPLDSLHREGCIEILCQESPGSCEFHHVRVPTAFFRENLSGLAIVKDRSISLFLSAETMSFLEDQRGSAKVCLREFQQ